MTIMINSRTGAQANLHGNSACKNAGNSTVSRDGQPRLRGRSAHPAVVPPAVVWEPRDVHPTSGIRHTYGATMTTLGVEHPSGSSVRKRCSRTSGYIGQEVGNLGTYILGAVFGLVIFAGTMLGGQAAEQSGSTPGSVAPAGVVQQLG